MEPIWGVHSVIAMLAVVVDLCIREKSGDDRAVCVIIFEVNTKGYILCVR